MDRRKAILLAFMVLVGGIAGGLPVGAQTFQNYHCADGTQFIVGFYGDDKRAFMQIDGKAVPLARRLTLSGARYSGEGITLKVDKTGATVRHLKRPVTECALI